MLVHIQINVQIKVFMEYNAVNEIDQHLGYVQ